MRTLVPESLQFQLFLTCISPHNRARIQGGDKLIGRAESSATKLRRGDSVQRLELDGRISACVHLSRLHVGVTQPQRDLAKIFRRFEHGQCTAVPEHVRRYTLGGQRWTAFDGRADVLLQDVLEAGTRHGFAAGVNEDLRCCGIDRTPHKEHVTTHCSP